MEEYYTPYGTEGAEIFLTAKRACPTTPPPIIGDLLPVVGLGGGVMETYFFLKNMGAQ